MDEVFSALANPVRRTLLDMLREGPRTAGSLADAFDLSRPAVAEHLAVLRDAHLVHIEKLGRERHYSLDAAALAGVGEWLHPYERYWRARLRKLRTVIDEENPTQ